MEKHAEFFKHHIGIAGQVLMPSFVLKAVVVFFFFSLTSHTALTQHVPTYFAMLYTGKDVSGTLGNLGSQKLLRR